VQVVLKKNNVKKKKLDKHALTADTAYQLSAKARTLPTYLHARPLAALLPEHV